MCAISNLLHEESEYTILCHFQKLFMLHLQNPKPYKSKSNEDSIHEWRTGNPATKKILLYGVYNSG